VSRLLPLGFSFERRRSPLFWDIVAVVLVFGTIVFLAGASRGLLRPLAALATHPVSLDPALLPEYAAKTTLRMFAAMALSLLFTFTYATLAAKSRRAERILVPLLDILQSVPILGFLSVTVVFFMSLAPGRELGAEFAAVFAIFTSQAWNMAFSFYQSLRTIPPDLDEVSTAFRFGGWMRFWRLEVPFAMPPLVWNIMMSMSGGWFFVVASEAISVGNTTVALPGIGSYIALAIERRDLGAVAWAIGAMLVVIMIYDQLLFRPLVAWSDRFRFEQESVLSRPRSWVLTMLARSRLASAASRPLLAAWSESFRVLGREPAGKEGQKAAARPRRWPVRLLTAALGLLVLAAVWVIGRFVLGTVDAGEALRALSLGLITMVRVFVLIALASVIWVPVGIWLGLNPRSARIAQPIAQFLAAFPANLLFPLAVSAIVAWHLDPDVWLSPLMVLGTQWYILFNVIAGASTIPGDMRDIASNLRVGGWLWWRRIALPAVFPFYVTGAITASGGSWNASIVAEVASWGDRTLRAHGIGAYIAEATAGGDFHRVALGIIVMSGLVVTINRLFWRPLYYYAERKYRLS